MAFFIKKFGSQISAVIGAILINSLSVVIGIPGSTWILAVGVSLLVYNFCLQEVISLLLLFFFNLMSSSVFTIDIISCISAENE